MTPMEYLKMVRAKYHNIERGNNEIVKGFERKSKRDFEKMEQPQHWQEQRTGMRRKKNV